MDSTITYPLILGSGKLVLQSFIQHMISRRSLNGIPLPHVRGMGTNISLDPLYTALHRGFSPSLTIALENGPHCFVRKLYTQLRNVHMNFHASFATFETKECMYIKQCSCNSGWPISSPWVGGTVGCRRYFWVYCHVIRRVLYSFDVDLE